MCAQPSPPGPSRSRLSCLLLGRAVTLIAEGGLVSLGPDLVAMTSQGAAYIGRIMRGAKPADLPVQQPTRYEFHINLKTAKSLGLTLPPSLLARADEVIE